jgi:hypothetical protein
MFILREEAALDHHQAVTKNRRSTSDKIETVSYLRPERRFFAVGAA